MTPLLTYLAIQFGCAAIALCLLWRFSNPNYRMRRCQFFLVGWLIPFLSTLAGFAGGAQ